MCPGTNAGTVDCISKIEESLAYIRGQCHGKTTCNSITVDNTITGNNDPCNGVRKFLEVKWICVRKYPMMPVYESHLISVESRDILSNLKDGINNFVSKFSGFSPGTWRYFCTFL